MTTEIKTLKKALVNSAVFGAGLAIPALVPNIMPIISLFVLPFLSAIVVLIYMLKTQTLGVDDMKDYALLGGIIGAASCFSFLVIFCPLVVFINFFQKTYYNYGINYLNFFLAIILLASLMLIFLVTNAAGGLLVGFLAKQFRRN